MVIGYSSFLLLFAQLQSASAQIPAFPGAEGFGAYASGGRTGDVYHVTTLSSSAATPGSFAYGLKNAPASGRTIVFDISGNIPVSGNLAVSQPNLTIAGQTAPGDGVGLIGGTFWIEKTNIVVRHFRFRNGVSADCLDMSSNAVNVIIDHCDTLFSTDENFSSFGSPPDLVTFQWSANAWGLHPHSAGGLWDVNRVTAHHTLWAHHKTRDPKARANGLLDWINNVTYDYAIGFIMGDSTTPADWKANVEGCYFACPPGNLMRHILSRASLDRYGGYNFSIWMTNCLFDSDGDYALDGRAATWSDVLGSYRQMTNAVARSGGIPVAQDPPLLAYKKVVSAVGPLRFDACHAGGLRDEVSEELVRSVLSWRKDMFTNVVQTGASGGGYGTLTSRPAPLDTDRDGMPDYWEATLGSNPASDDHRGAVAAGAFLPAAPAGYTRLEEYLQFLAMPHASVDRNSALDVDLRRYTAGFTNTPVTYALSAASTGLVALVDGCIARYRPPTNYTGRAAFDFGVTDGDGGSWTQTFAVLVSATLLPRDLVWKGDGGTNVWDTNTLAFVEGATAAPAAFRQDDTVTFDDDGDDAPSVQLTGSLRPGAVTVDNNAKHYTFAGAGTIGGTGSLTKRGSGRLALLSNLTNSGPIRIEGGTVVMGSATGSVGRIGPGELTLSGGGALSNAWTAAKNIIVSPIAVPAGETGTIFTSRSIMLTGTVSGAGTLVIVNQNATGDVQLAGLADAFSGDVRFVSAGTNPVVQTMFAYGSFRGFPLASVDLGATNRFQPYTMASGNTFPVGALTGDASTALGGGTGGGAITYSIGGLNRDSSFGGSIQANAKLTKTGTGTLTLTGTGVHTGATTVAAGMLRMNGTATVSRVTVSTNATLSGGGRLGGGLNVITNGILSPGVAGPGTLTVSNGLSLTDAVLSFDLTMVPTGSNDRIVMQGGALALTNAQTLAFNLTDGQLGAGVYALIDGGTTTLATNLSFRHSLPTGTRQGIGITAPAGRLLLNVTNDLAALLWRGTNGAAWDQATANWLNAGLPDRFWRLDSVLFDDTSTNGLVSLSGSLEPRTVVVSNVTRPYVFSGPGVITGTTSIVKMGAGTLTILNTNFFSGGLLARGGVVATGSADASTHAMGAGAVTLDGGALELYGYGLSTGGDYGAFTNDLIVNSTGLLRVPPRCQLGCRVSGTGALEVVDDYVRADFSGDWSGFAGWLSVRPRSSSAEFRLAGATNLDAAALSLSNGITLYPTGANQTIAIGELSGAAGSTLGPGNGSGVNPTWVVGRRNGSATFEGTIADAGVTQVIKDGSGAWTLTGSNTFGGGVTVRGGALMVNNVAGSGTGTGSVDVQEGATLGGTGTLAGAVTVEGDAVLSPGGAAVGTLTLDNALTLAAGSVTLMDVNKASGTNDLILCHGPVAFDGELVINNRGGALALGDSFKIFSSASARGNFSTISAPPARQAKWEFNPASGVLRLVEAFEPGTARYEARIEFNGYDRAETLTNFPVLVSLGNHVPGFDYNTFLTDDGSDLRFRVAGATNTLNHEIEAWNPGGESLVWVQVPSFSNGCALIASWGYSKATNALPCATNGATWSQGYAGVWHFRGAVGTDSSHGRHDASTNITAAAAGLVGDGAGFDGASTQVRIPFHTDFNLASNFEVQGWFKVPPAYKPSAGKYLVLTSKEVAADYNNRNWWLSIQSDGKLWWKCSDGVDVLSPTNLADGVWHFVSAEHEGTAARLYIDGEAVAADLTPGLADTQSAPLLFGLEDGTTRFFKGSLDEMRVSSVSRSSNWVWAVYHNLQNAAAFVTYGEPAVVSLPPPPSQYGARISFPGYSRDAVLTNFPALVQLGTNIANFRYSQLNTPDGADLRFTTADGLSNLNYEVDGWTTSGTSRVWVQVPLFSNGCSIVATWGNPEFRKSPPCTSNGATWSEGFLGVWHLRETNGSHYDSSPWLATSRWVQVSAQGTAAGIVGGCDQFSAIASNYVSLPDMGTNAAVTVESWVYLTGTPAGADVGLVSSDPWGTGITHFKTSNSLQLKGQIGGGGTVNSSSNVLAVSNWCFAAYTIAGGGTNDFRTYCNGLPLGAAAGRVDNNLTDVNIAREYNGRYLGARVDEVRVSSVARSSNWLWAVYGNIASNGSFNAYGPATNLFANTAPALIALADRTERAGQWLYITNAASDDQAPPQSLTFSMPVCPAGALLNPSNGLFSWRPTVTQAASTNPVTIVVTDSGLPPLSGTQDYAVVVAPLDPTTVDTLTVSNGQFGFHVSGAPGPDYTVQISTNLIVWTNLFRAESPAMPFDWVDAEASNSRVRFYRLLLGP